MKMAPISMARWSGPIIIIIIPCLSSAAPCAPFQFDWPPLQWTRHVDSTFYTVEAAVAYCNSSGVSASCSSGDGINVCVSNPGYYVCWYNNWSTNDQYFGAACLSDPCGLKRDQLEDECGATGYILDEETCEGQCVGCPDSDDDGTKDACDFCPDNSNYGLKQIKKYKVPKLTICGTYLYEGESCGYSVMQCDGSEEFHVVSPTVIDAVEMWRCCRATYEEEECIVDKDCQPVKGDGVCECPDGSTDCEFCKEGKCTCPDTDDDGQPNSPCYECQMDGCTCPDTDFDGEPNSPCADCQDEDGDGQPDGGGGGGTIPPPPTPGDTDGDDIPDNEDPCPNNPDPNCEPGDEDGDDIPDDKDPCPDNPDPNCTTTCLTTVDKFRAWTSTAESFPFNWMAGVKNMFGPFTRPFQILLVIFLSCLSAQLSPARQPILILDLVIKLSAIHRL